MTAPVEVLDLIHRFQQGSSEYQDQHYNETSVRVEFINPFFKALGWDIENIHSTPEVHRDVIHEDKVKVGNALKAPDYSFWIDGVRKFFVEAKKPYVKLKTDTKPAFQLRSYGWSAGLPLSILTSFEELVVYDCRVEPKEKEDPRNAQLLHIPFAEYDARWEEIDGLFSKAAVRSGSLEQFAEANKGLRGSITVDKAFLTLIEHWREILAFDIARWDTNLTPSDLNFAVQMTIDRIVFLRICEDRGIEEYGRLLGITNGGRVYARLTEQFKAADTRYNSGLFHFNEEKGRENPDTLTLRLQVGDETLQHIIRQMYPPTPYAFDVIPIEILGNVYEQFLGKVIQVNKKYGMSRGVQLELTSFESTIEIVEKPEVRKAGGVY